jgi:hypothetical protein
MRKLFLLSVVAGLFFAACGTKSGETACSDSTAVDSAQTVAVDSAAADTAK